MVKDGWGVIMKILARYKKGLGVNFFLKRGVGGTGTPSPPWPPVMYVNFDSIRVHKMFVPTPETITGTVISEEGFRSICIT